MSAVLSAQEWSSQALFGTAVVVLTFSYVFHVPFIAKASAFHIQPMTHFRIPGPSVAYFLHTGRMPIKGWPMEMKRVLSNETAATNLLDSLCDRSRDLLCKLPCWSA